MVNGGRFYKAKNEVGSRGPRLADPMGMLSTTIALLPKVYICIDELDECLPKCLPELLESLRNLVRESPGRYRESYPRKDIRYVSRTISNFH